MTSQAVRAIIPVALTGGIASGKSTVAKLFSALGVAVIDADATYHGLLLPQAGKPSPLSAQLAREFTTLALLRQDGTIDRQALGAHVFSDAAARRRLEALTHPAVGAAVADRMRQLHDAGVYDIIYDVPLLYEKQLESGFRGVICVWVPLATQRDRLVQRDGCDASAAQQRLAAQMPLDEKRQRATWVIDNSYDLAATQKRVEEVYKLAFQKPN